jgi:hypothetical protein
MNFLQMCQRVYQEGGISGQISTVVNQVGEPKRVVGWVQSAYLELLNDQALAWNFLKGETSKQLVVGQGVYDFVTDFALPGGVQWDTRSMRVAANADLSDETFLIEQRFPLFRDFWLFSSRRTVQSRPLNCAVDDQTNLRIAPLPDMPYWLTFKWQEMPPMLAVDTDTMIIPERFEMVVVWLALRHYGMFEAAPEVVSRADKHYQIMKQQLENDQSYEVVVGGPIC